LCRYTTADLEGAAGSLKPNTVKQASMTFKRFYAGSSKKKGL